MCANKKVHYTLIFINKSNNSTENTDDDVGADDDDYDGDADYHSQHFSSVD